jgi:hypothetical protein
MNIYKRKLISFELAKLLKEKGFDIPVYYSYTYSTKSKKHKEDGYSGPFGWKKGELNINEGYFINKHKDVDYTNKYWYYCAAPEIWLLIEYFIEKYKYFVQVSITIDDKWYFEIYNLIDKRNGELPVPFTYYKTKDDAYHEAFKYLLIKVL